jgi:hypothetical protein
MWSLPTPLSVYNLSVALHDRLPPELSDMVYAHILDGETMKEVVQAHSNSWDPYQGHTETTDAWPEFLKPKYLDSGVTNELVQAFCKHNEDFRSKDCTLDRLLSHRVFRTPITLGTSVISALTLQLSSSMTEETFGRRYYEAVYKPLET